MLRRLLTLCLAFSFVMTSVHASSTDGLKLAFEELQFALEVEWDQKDPAFKKAQLEKFSDRLNELKAQGLTNSDLIASSIGQIKDESLRKQIETANSLIAINHMSEVEARKMIQENFEKSLSKGASWNCESFLTIGAVVLFVVLAIVVASKPIEPEAPKPIGEQPDGSFCGYTQVCRWEEPDCSFS